MAAVINTIAGTGQKGYSGDNGPALKSTMDNPFHVALDPTETQLYFADCFNFFLTLNFFLSEVLSFIIFSFLLF